MKNIDLNLHKLTKCYLRGSLAFTLKPTDVETMTLEWQQKLLNLTVNSELVKQYPLRSSFTKLFFKLMITYLENREIHDDMYTQLVRAINTRNGNSFSYRHYVIGDDLTELITVKETNKMVLEGTTGMRTWEAGLMLADWALGNSEIFSGKKVLELGSGVGFTGVTIAKHCAPQSIYLTDCQSKILNVICDNIQINFPDIMPENEEEILFKNNGQDIGAIILDWNAIENLSSDIVPDVIIGADIVFDPTTIQPLCDVLKALFERNKQADVYIASVIRKENTFRAFLNCLDTMNFSYEKLPLSGSSYIDWDENVEHCLLQINY